MVNFELSVNNLKQRIKGIKLPGSLEELRHTVNYGKTTVEVPISGIPNSEVVLEVLGKSETPKLVLENGEEVDLLEDGSVNVKPSEKEDKHSETVSHNVESTGTEIARSAETHTESPSGDGHPVTSEETHTEVSPEPHVVTSEVSPVGTSGEDTAVVASEERSASGDTEEHREPAVVAGGVRPAITEGDHL